MQQPTAPKTADNVGSVASFYKMIEPDRFPYLTRARDCAAVTIPYLMPPLGTSGATTLPTPWQSMGARGLNNLAAKLLLALLPPNAPFFRLHMEDFVKNQLANDPAIKGDMEKALSQIERAIMSDIETSTVRVTLFETIKHLINSGNALAYLPPQGGMRFYRIDHYVCQRDTFGTVVRGIIKEERLYSTLPAYVQAMCKDRVTDNDNDNDDTVCVYTDIQLFQDLVYKVHQELADGQVIPGSRSVYPKDKTPYLFLRWMKMEGENYGRGHAEEYLGDLQSLDGLSASIIQGAAIAAKVVFLVDPNGTTQAEDINKAENGDAVTGRKDEVVAFQADKFADFRVALETIANIEKRLSQAFMLTSSVQRDAERVTAEEIRLMATELESSIGGVYSILSQEFQLPFLRRVMARMETAGKLPKLPSGTIRPTIVTGLEALGRGAELNKIITFTKVLQEALGEQAAAALINGPSFGNLVGAQLGLDTTAIVKTQQQMDDAAKAAQRQQTIQALGPDAMKAAAAAGQQSNQG